MFKLSNSAAFHINFRDDINNNCTNKPYICDTNLLLPIPPLAGTLFLWVFSILTVISLFGNIFVIYTTCKRNYRYLQKTCIISLACSDLLSTTSIFWINSNDFISHVLIWPFGEFLCKALPMCQTVGIFVSSTALVFIAMDRYRNVVKALNNRWDPKMCYCIAATITLWILAFVIADPIYNAYDGIPACMLYAATDQKKPVMLCLTPFKQNLGRYYVSLVIVIFLPLLIIFIWFYYNIAILVWNHRKPLSLRNNNKQDSSGTENTSFNSKIVVEVKHPNKTKTQNTVAVERKIRSFKIIITLMVTFIVFRLPYFGATIYQLLVESKDGDNLWNWYLSYSFLLLQILDCCLNPLLYTFLNQTLKVWNSFTNSISKFTCEVCFYCCSDADFADFNNVENQNPFIVENYNLVNDNKRHSKVTSRDKCKY